MATNYKLLGNFLTELDIVIFIKEPARKFFIVIKTRANWWLKLQDVIV